MQPWKLSSGVVTETEGSASGPAESCSERTGVCVVCVHSSLGRSEERFQDGHECGVWSLAGAVNTERWVVRGAVTPWPFFQETLSYA